MGPDPFRTRRAHTDCKGGCGGGSGEPHMKTFDRARFDLQAVGEFVLASSNALTMQMHTLPCHRGTTARTDASRVTPMGEGAVAVPVSGVDGTLALSGRDAEDGTERVRGPTPAHDCAAMVGSGATVLFNDRGRLVTVDTANETRRLTSRSG